MCYNLAYTAEMHIGCTFLPFHVIVYIFFLSVVEMREVFQQPVKPSEAMEILQKVKMMVIRVLTIVAGGLLI